MNFDQKQPNFDLKLMLPVMVSSIKIYERNDEIILSQRVFIENVEIMKTCGKEMIKGALRLYINPI